jgi:hypothetical protein
LTVLAGLGKQHLKQDRVEKAREVLANAESILREASATIDLAKLLLTRAELECRMGDTAAAAATLGEAEAIAEKVGANAQSELGRKIAKLREGIPA